MDCQAHFARKQGVEAVPPAAGRCTAEPVGGCLSSSCQLLPSLRHCAEMVLGAASRLAQGGRSGLLVECNNKKGLGVTLGGTRRCVGGPGQRLPDPAAPACIPSASAASSRASKLQRRAVGGSLLGRSESALRMFHDGQAPVQAWWNIWMAAAHAPGCQVAQCAHANCTLKDETLPLLLPPAGSGLV